MKTIANWLNPQGIDLPLSEAVTGWELCQELKVVVREEWRRVSMRHIQSIVDVQASNAPACGVVGCLAGWGMALRKIASNAISQEWDEAMKMLLGPDVDYNTVGPSGGIHVFNDGHGDECSTTTPGTRAHARAVVKRLDRFMRLNEKALKARILPPLGQLTGGATIVPDAEAPVGC